MVTVVSVPSLQRALFLLCVETTFNLSDCSCIFVVVVAVVVVVVVGRLTPQRTCINELFCKEVVFFRTSGVVTSPDRSVIFLILAC